MNEFLPFAIGIGANVQDQDDYASDATRAEGITKGILYSSKTNKIWRQSTFVASGTAQMIETILQEDVLDDGNLVRFTGQLIRAIEQIASSSVVIGANPPNRADPGTLWFDTDSGQLFVYFDDGTSSQWMIANHGNTGTGSSPGLDYLPTTGGYMSGPIILFGPPTQANEAASKEYVDTRVVELAVVGRAAIEQFDGGEY